MDSNYHYSIVRLLFKYHRHNVAVLAPRLITGYRTLKTVVNNPRRFVVKPFKLLYKDPRKLYNILTGSQGIQDWERIKVGLTDEYGSWQKKQTRSAPTAKSFKKEPLISIITPVFNPPADVLKQLIESVLVQSYGKFELLLYSFGTSPDIDSLIEQYAHKDGRIKFKVRLPNQGISGNSNTCLEDVEGAFVGLLDHDDLLEPDALLECVKVINRSDADFIYTDKDKITEEGQRFEPFYKPDWSPELELGGNYLTHFNLIRTSLLRKIGGWDPNTDGAQDWDIFLRLTEVTDKIVHIPKILYHWRTVKGSTANEISAKPYVIEAQKRTLTKYFTRANLEAAPLINVDGQMYVDWQMKSEPTIYLVHLLYKDAKGVKRLLESIVQGSGYHPQSQIYLFTLPDDLDSRHRQRLSSACPSLEIIEYPPGEFIKTVVETFRQSKSDHIIYINDAVKKMYRHPGSTDSLNQLAGWLEIPGVGMAGGLVQSRGGKVVDCGSFFDKTHRHFFKYYFGTGFRSGYIGYLQWIRNFILVSEQIFSFNTTLLKILSEHKSLLECTDQEFATALAAVNFSQGDRAVYDPSVVAVSGAPFYLANPYTKSLGSFMDNHCPELIKAGDPYYNPNLNNSYIDPKPASPQPAVHPNSYGLLSAE